MRQWLKTMIPVSPAFSSNLFTDHFLPGGGRDRALLDRFGSGPQRLNTIALEGPPYNRGLVHGKILKEQIHEVIRLWKVELAQDYGGDADAFIARFVRQTSFIPAIKKWTPDLLDEVMGVADGCGIDFDTLFVFQLADEYWMYGRDIAANRCSSLGFCRNGKTPAIIAQNMDLECFRDGFQVVLHIKPEDSDLEAFILSHAGFIGFNGLNSKAIGVCCNTLSQLAYCRDGLPVACIVRGVLQQRTAGDAIAFLHRIRHASGQNYIIGSPEKVHAFECSANKITSYKPSTEEDTVWHTNHPLANDDYNAKYIALQQNKEEFAKDQENTWIRLQSVERRLSGSSVVKGLDLIKTTLASQDSAEHPVCRPVTKKDWFTFASTIMILSAEPEFHVAAGPPDVTPYEKFSFRPRAN
jgi:isopenicillin-N N-acyltransferase-like protein